MSLCYKLDTSDSFQQTLKDQVYQYNVLLVSPRFDLAIIYPFKTVNTSVRSMKTRSSESIELISHCRVYSLLYQTKSVRYISSRGNTRRLVYRLFSQNKFQGCEQFITVIGHCWSEKWLIKTLLPVCDFL